MSMPDPFPADSPLVSQIAPSPKFGERMGGVRPSMLILHYTGLPTCEEALRVLSSPKSGVSCHYVIDADGAITQMAPASLRGPGTRGSPVGKPSRT